MSFSLKKKKKNSIVGDPPTGVYKDTVMARNTWPKPDEQGKQVKNEDAELQRGRLIKNKRYNKNLPQWPPVKENDKPIPKNNFVMKSSNESVSNTRRKYTGSAKPKTYNFKTLTKSGTKTSSSDEGSTKNRDGDRLPPLNELVDLELGTKTSKVKTTTNSKRTETTNNRVESTNVNVDIETEKAVSKSENFSSGREHASSHDSKTSKRISKKRLLDKQEMTEILNRKKAKQAEKNRNSNPRISADRTSSVERMSTDRNSTQRPNSSKQSFSFLRMSRNRKSSPRLSKDSTVTIESLPSRFSNKRGVNERPFSYSRLGTGSSVSAEDTDGMGMVETASTTSDRSSLAASFFKRSDASSKSSFIDADAAFANDPMFAAKSSFPNAATQRRKKKKSKQISEGRNPRRKIPHNLHYRGTYNRPNALSISSGSTRTRSDTLHSALSSILDPLSYTMKSSASEQLDDALAPFKHMVSRVTSIGSNANAIPKTEEAFKKKYKLICSMEEAFNNVEVFPPPTYDPLAIYPDSDDTLAALERAKKIGFEVRYTKVWVMAKRALERQIKIQTDLLEKNAPSQFKVLSLNRAIVAMEDLHRIGAQIRLHIIRPFRQFIIDMGKQRSRDQMERNAKKIVKILSFRLKSIIIRENKIRSYPIGLILKEGKWKCDICTRKKGPKARYQKRLHCSHVFHKDCLDEWLEDHYVCPTCNADAHTKPPTDYTSCYRFFCEWFYYVAFIFPVVGILFGLVIAGVGIAIDELFNKDQLDNEGFFKNVLISYVLSFTIFGALSQGLSCLKFFGKPEYDSDVWLIFPSLLALVWAPFFAYAMSDAFKSTEFPDETLKATWRAFGVFFLCYITAVTMNHYCGMYCACYSRFWERACWVCSSSSHKKEDDQESFEDDMSDFTESSFDSMDAVSVTFSMSGPRELSPSTTKVVVENGESSFL